jgi:hypothetical protein
VDPSSTPAGTCTLKVVVTLRRPSPRQSAQGDSMMVPTPAQRGHTVAVTIWPRIELRTRRTSPAPPHSGHVVGDVPAAQPLPAQVSQRCAIVRVISRVAPKAASSRVISRATSASGPGWGPRRVPARPPMPPKNMSKMSCTEPASKGLPGPVSDPKRS